ncbi:hypothetical protein HYQ13_gp46 [Lactococcus phage CHPC52]|uniref:Uncharacterized protein n=1 Tax=Lactococcus phage CHPC52 TaxID=2675251 RepID=A0A650F7U3_9CAUD|nr:hypothetical protein HYQ13_gp46 [Lactococcus phage CHPC52]QGT53055.1 hypothetical protein CHPC52_000712 [Lactococcus phage CHPC52]
MYLTSLTNNSFFTSWKALSYKPPNQSNKKDIALTDTILYKQDTQCTYFLPLLVKLRSSVKQNP